MKPALIPYPNKITFSDGSFILHEGFTADCASLFHDSAFSGEHYSLCASADGVKITAGTEEGFFRGKTTLGQLHACNKTKLPFVFIDDEPAFSYRGFHIDSVRHMQTVSELERMIDAAALFKFNYFHWHLSDDQGYRLESERFPALNEKASFRESSDFGNIHINERYGGYYTKQEIRHIVEYCTQRFIEVVPEIDMPGHISAILHAFPGLSCHGVSPGVKTTAGIFKDVLCPGQDETFAFIFGLLDEVSELFPCKYFHIGGDETPKLRWNSCPKCRARMQVENLKDTEQLQLYFTNRVTAYIAEKGKTAVCWNETLKGGAPENEPVIQNWMDKDNRCPAYADNGGRLIMSDFYNYYCDYPYSMTPLKKTYGFNPCRGLSETGKKNLLGVETALWTEYIGDFRRLTSFAYPRFAAVAENGWSRQETKYYKSFHMRFLSIRHMLLKIGIVPAAESEWNPHPLMRLAGTIKFFSGNISKNTIKDFFIKSDNE